MTQQPLAPAAALANVALPPPAGAAVRERYTPKPKDQQVAELLSLRAGQGGHTESVAPKIEAAGADHAHPTPPTKPVAAAAAGPDTPPPGYVPSEPGSLSPGASSPAAAHPATAERPADAGSAAGKDGSTVVAALTAASLPAIASPATSAHGDAVATARELRAAPMTSQDQVQVLGLVTEMAALVHDLRTQDAQLRSDLQKNSADTNARLVDFERRIAFAEARSAVSGAHDAGAVSASPAASETATAKPAPVVLMRAEAALPATDTGPAKRYRVQAASPGLALLAEVDRGGGDGAQMQVAVGETIAGYGRIKSIAQKGTSWVVTTERGAIQ